MQQVLWIAAGGALGSALRYLIGVLTVRWWGGHFPYGTLAVNIVGAFFLGAVMFAGSKPGLLSPSMRLTIGTGLLGGFTTYSSFAFETLQMIQRSAWFGAIAYAAGSAVAAVSAAGLGYGLMRAVTR
ncbi:MAG: fluoride efflux transporter CrcB [Deltaproteobacteria bacterium]|nr:fluoride efflux transporter CrcB [Deltaproteobacteria bacterium]